MKARSVALLLIFGVAVVAGWFVFVRDAGTSAKREVAPAGPDPWDVPSAARSREAASMERAGGEPLTVLIDDDPPGALRLEGLVLAAGEQPVAGATVVLAANPPRTALTDENGAFAFDALVGRPYTLVARSALGTSGPITAKLTATSDPVVLRLAPGGSAKVLVVDGEQRPVAATVELRGLDVQTATAGADGIARFESVVPGRYDVMASAPGHAPRFGFITVAAAPVETTIVLLPGAEVSGRVVDVAGAGVADALVVFDGASDWNIQADARRDGVRSGKDGSFRFAALPAGSFRFVGRHPAHAQGSSGIVMLDGVTPRPGVEIRLSAGATVRGKVVDPEGRPVASARVRVGVASSSMIAAEPRQVFSADDGSFTLAGVPRRPLQAVALAENGSSETVAVDASRGDVQGLVLVIGVNGSIAGTVVDKQGEPIEGVQVSALPDLQSGNFDPATFRLRGFVQDLTDAGGRFELVGLAPGAYQVRAARSVGRGRMPTFDGERARTGTRDVRIVLPMDGAVTGKVLLADGTVPSPFTVGVGSTQEPVTSKDGSFVLSDVPPRKYQLVVRGPEIDQKSVTIEVVEGETTDVGTITVGKGRSIAGVVRFEGKAVPDATVLAGRQVFGTGTSNTAKFGGPPGRANNRETTTDEQGRFVIGGLGPNDVAVVAEHPALGRSAARRVMAGAADERELVLDLAPFGTLRGKATDGEGPATETIVTAQSVTAGNVTYSVITGADGTYRFDKLAPDLYKVSAMLGMPLRGMTFHSTQATVVSGKETVADLTVKRGEITLTITARAREGEFRGGYAWLFSGIVAARNGRELQARVAAHESGTETLSIMFAGRPAIYSDLVPGSYTICASAIPSEITDPMQGQGYIERHGDEVPATCKPLVVAAAPREQAAEIEVEIPPFIPD